MTTTDVGAGTHVPVGRRQRRSRSRRGRPRTRPRASRADGSCCAGSSATGSRWSGSLTARAALCACRCSARCSRRGPTTSTTTPRSCSRPRPATGSARRQIGEDVFAQTMRGLQKSLTIGLLTRPDLDRASPSLVGRLGRVLRRLGRPRADVGGRPAPRAALVPHHRGDLPRAARQQLDPVRAAAGRVRLDDHRADPARDDADAARARVRQGRAVHGRPVVADHPAAHPAEHGVADDHRRHDHGGRDHPARDRAVLLRLRRAAARRLAGHPHPRPAATRRSPRPWLFLFAGGLLVISVLAVNFIGDGLRDALDPNSRGGRRRSKSARKTKKVATS